MYQKKYHFTAEIITYYLKIKEQRMKRLFGRSLRVLTPPSLACLLSIQLIVPVAAVAQTADGKTATTGDDISDRRVAEILKKHLKAVGEEATAKTVETITETEMNGGVTKTYRLDDLTAGRFYQLQEGPNGKAEIAFDGKKMWRKTAFARSYLSDSDPFFKASTQKRTAISEKKFKLLPNEKLDGKDYLVMQTVDADPQGNQVEVKYYFDPATYLIRQTVMGNEIKQTVVFDDYRSVNGRTISFSRTLVTPRVTLKTKTISVKYDVSFDEKKLRFEEESKQSGNGSAAEKLPSQFVSSSFNAETGEGTILAENLRLETFETVWKTINESYWDKNFGGINWQAMHEKYLPLVKETQLSEPFHRLLNKMLAELGRSHLKVFPPSKTIGYNTKKEDLRNGVTGFDVRWLDSQLTVTEVI